jgi:hypothetical protein
MDANDFPQTLFLRTKGRVPSEAADEFSDLIKSDVEIHEAVSRMKQTGGGEAMIMITP